MRRKRRFPKLSIVYCCHLLETVGFRNQGDMAGTSNSYHQQATKCHQISQSWWWWGWLLSTVFFGKLETTGRYVRILACLRARRRIEKKIALRSAALRSQFSGFVQNEASGGKSSRFGNAENSLTFMGKQCRFCDEGMNFVIQMIILRRSSIQNFIGKRLVRWTDTTNPDINPSYDVSCATLSSDQIISYVL